MHAGAEVTFSTALTVLLSVAEMVAATVPVCTLVVVALKLAVLAPDGSETEAGTETTLLLLDKATTAPFIGAGGLMVMVPIELLPPTTVVGFSVNDVTESTGEPH